MGLRSIPRIRGLCQANPIAGSANRRPVVCRWSRDGRPRPPLQPLGAARASWIARLGSGRRRISGVLRIHGAVVSLRDVGAARRGYAGPRPERAVSVGRGRSCDHRAVVRRSAGQPPASGDSRDRVGRCCSGDLRLRPRDRMTRFRSEDAFASLDRQDWPEIAVKACRLAIRAAGVDDTTALDALRALERRTVDAEAAASMCELADRFDQAAWDAQAASDYDVLFRRARLSRRLPSPCRKSLMKRSTKPRTPLERRRIS